MPLTQGKSAEAFKQNVKAEMSAGKPQKQALAIAYNVKRHNAKKMAKGGMYAEGGEVVKTPEVLKESAQYELEKEKSAHPAVMEPKKLVAAIMKHRMAKGGMIEDSNNEEMPIDMGHAHDDFLSDEADSEMPSWESMAEGGMAEEDHEMKKKMMLHKILNSVRYGKD